MTKKVILIIFLILSPIIIAVIFFSQKTSAKPKVATNTATIKPSTAKKTEIIVPKVTLDSIFSLQETDLSKLDQTKIIKLIATGDVIPARGANWPAVQKNNFNFNWEKTADYLKTGDITLINLEAPLMKSCQLSTSGFTFCGNARQVEGMVFAGIDVANLMNNHIGNFGSTGISETKKLLDDNQILWSGFGSLAIKEIKGKKFGFLGYNGIGVKIDREAMATEIKDSKTKVDILIVSVHWGKEYEALPLSDGNIAPDNPIEIGHLMIDSGADLIIGNHPHWVQGVEIFKDKFIAYAHGNFIFDQTWSEETQEGVVGEYTFYLPPEASAKEGGVKLIAVKYKPIVVDKSYQPVFVTGTRADKILKQMQDSSTQLAK